MRGTINRKDPTDYLPNSITIKCTLSFGEGQSFVMFSAFEGTSLQAFIFLFSPFFFAHRAITRENMSSTPNLEDQVSGSMDGPTSEDRVHGSLGNLKPPLAELSKAPPSTAVFNTSTLGAFTPLSKDSGTEQNTALSYLLTYVTEGVAQTLKKEIDDSVRNKFNETLAAQTPVKVSAPVPGTSDSDNESPGSVAEIPEPKRYDFTNFDAKYGWEVGT